ncbi:MAG TPA: M20 family metallopeptidase [Terrimicrobiaceae bacterium]|nr:M20 family metallopeptidase [Terrimicrobiaceae bacterium]
MTVVETTQALVRIPSVNPGYDPSSHGEAGVTAWLLAWGADHGVESFTQEVFPGRSNVVFRVCNGADGPHLLLNGHTDTVAVDAMTIPPFGGEIRDGRLWGRGASDMKGPLACMLHALLELRENPSLWRGTVTLACVVDEELGFAGIRHFLRTAAGIDSAIVGEPTCFAVVRGCKGCLRFFVRAHGRSAHSSTPEKGVSAISAMARAIAALEAHFAGPLAANHHPSLGRSTGSIGIIRGGSGVNIVPDFCEIQVDIRLVPGQSWERTYDGVRGAVENSSADVRWEFDPSPLADPSFCLAEDHPAVRRVCAAAGRPASQVVNFSCDASKIAAAGIPCVVFGPGDIAHAHTADESIAIEDLARGVAGYVRIAQALLPP